VGRLELRSVNKWYGSLHAVRDLDLRMEEGEFVVLLGPSGCGKTTTLLMIAGLEKPSSGEIHLGDRLIDHVPPHRRDIAVVFQSYALYPHLTVFENIAYPLRMQKRPKSEIAERVSDVAETLAISSVLERRPKQLSGGQRQRVALERAIVRRPQMFLLDEPLSNVDALLRIQMRTDLKSLQQRIGKTFIYVTHDQVDAMTMATKVVVMRDGAVEQVGTTREVYKQPANRFVASFMGSPTMNFVNGSIGSANGRPSFRAEGIEWSVANLGLPAGEAASIEAGVRPEGLVAAPASGDTTANIGVVRIIESMGADEYAVVDCGPNQLRVRASSDHGLAAGDRVTVTPRVEQLHLFNATNGRRLGTA
jgi:multiple sugar transport system ATP-binding protein